jgi:hypothetical protein
MTRTWLQRTLDGVLPSSCRPATAAAAAAAAAADLLGGRARRVHGSRGRVAVPALLLEQAPVCGWRAAVGGEQQWVESSSDGVRQQWGSSDG